MGETTPDEREYVIDPARFLRWLVLAIVVLTLLSTITQVMHFYLPDFVLRDLATDMFFVANEQNVPTLFSALLLLACGWLAFVIARIRRRTGGSYVRHWTALSLLLLYVTIDEFVSLHERSLFFLRAWLDIDDGLFFYAWVIPGLAIVTMFAVAFVGFLKNLPLPSRRWMLLGAVILVAGAIGVEMFEGSYSAVHGPESKGYVVLVTIEEALEMLGAALLFSGVLAYLGVVLPNGRAGLRISRS